MSTEFKDPDSGEQLTPQQWEALKGDCERRLVDAASNLNDLLRRAAALGLDSQVVVLDSDESKKVVELSPMPEKVIARIPKRVQGPKYSTVVVLPPDVDVIYPGDPRHPDYPDTKK